MIQASEELRRGNLVFGISHSEDVRSKYVVIERIGKDRVVASNWHFFLDELEGIPITKELLVDKCGFESKSNYDFTELRNFGSAHGIGLLPDGVICFFYDFDVDYALPPCGESLLIRLPHIKYLHQLQNLIFILQNKELEIKL